MKKVILPLGISFVITLIGMAINYFGFRNNRWMPLSYKMYGGEFMGQYGFGWSYRHIYTMMDGGKDTVSFSFSLISFLISWLLVFILVILIVSIIRFIRKKS